MPWQRSSTAEGLPTDPVVEAVAEVLAEMLFGATVDVRYAPTAEGCDVTIDVRLTERVDALARAEGSSLAELVDALPGAGLRAADQLGGRSGPAAPVTPALQRALRDTVASEVLVTYLSSRLARPPRPNLVAETIEFLIELSGLRVEAHHLTHGVVVADAYHDTPRLALRYPADIRAAKRAPLLFDGVRAVLVVDPDGRARTELQAHRLMSTSAGEGLSDVGAVVAEATAMLGGIGFFVRADRSIWTYVDGRPLLVRRGEHWTAFPLELTASIANLIGGGAVADLVARAALHVSTQPGGAILAIVDDPAGLAGAVPLKDRYDLRAEIDRDAMRPETRLHHLIDATELDEHTLARLAMLDGATIVDRSGRLIAYGAIVTTTDSQHEGARTAAARTLSLTAAIVLMVSVDGDITIFHDGEAVTTLLGQPRGERREP